MLPGLPQLTPHHEDGKMVCLAGEHKLVFYSSRSGIRDRRLLSSWIAGAAEKIPLIVAPYCESFAPLFAKKQPFYLIAPVLFSPPPDDPRLIASQESLETFINNITADDKFHVHILPQWRELKGVVAGAVAEILKRAAIRLKTIRHFARLWQTNFQTNYPQLRDLPDIRQLRTPPSALVMAGPSLDLKIRELRQLTGAIWCADTALPVLVHYRLFPQVVFSIDAGFASLEHFCGLVAKLPWHKIGLVADPLCQPAILRMPFAKKYTYASSHPLVQEFAVRERPDLTEIKNPSGDVGGLMLAVKAALFPQSPTFIAGYDLGHRRHISHARGTAYFQRGFWRTCRIFNVETYSLKLSQRYGAATS
ncbi:MAG: DUF115 domain-containing protein [Turneriella sp.]|nr:DUF115 domain-containing protein [Turneriella sp.]